MEGEHVTRTARNKRCSDGGASLLHPPPRWQSRAREDRGKRATVAIFRRASFPSPLVGEGRGPSRSDGKGEGDFRWSSAAEPYTPSSFRRFAPPSFSHKGRRNFRAGHWRIRQPERRGEEGKPPHAPAPRRPLNANSASR